ncbi:MAG TPA: hypothetical protein VGM10_31705 [Actinocrinis sp.]
MAGDAGSADGQWAAFLTADPPGRRVAEDWLARLARNPAAPAALLMRLLDTDAFLHVLPPIPAPWSPAASTPAGSATTATRPLPETNSPHCCL